MADGDIALPVGHVAAGAAAPPALRVCIGRPFRQPVDLPDSGDCSAGLEVWVHEDDPDRRLFAVFDGELRFTADLMPGAAEPADVLVLEVSAGTQSRHNEIQGLLEPVPQRVVYENVDPALVQDALRDLIRGAYTGTAGVAAASAWHPAMRIEWLGARLKEQLDAADAAGTLIAEIENVVGAVRGAAGLVLPVRAGDAIGAAAALAGDLPPSGCPFAGAARRVTVYIEEYADNQLNPAFYVWRLLKNAHGPAAQRQVQMVSHAPLRADNTFDHPFLDALDIDLDVTVLPRVCTADPVPGAGARPDVLLFPLGRLAEWRGVNWGGAQSTIEWRITNDANLDFETRLRPGFPAAALADVDVNPDPAVAPGHINRAQQVWNRWGADLNDICIELQFPTEIVAVTIAHESDNNARALALEGLFRNHERRLQDAGVPQPIIDEYRRLTPRYGLTVPDIWPGAVEIDARRSSLTWDQLLDIVDVVPDRMSPGLTQTLVSRAEECVAWLGEWYGNVAATFGVVALPAQPRDWFMWLLGGREAILASTAYHKSYYCRSHSYLELPRLGSLYNSTRRRLADRWEPTDAPQLRDADLPGGPGDPPREGPLRPNPWRMRYTNLVYPRRISRDYNAFQELFSAGANARARFWRTL